jgi:molecular chaperone GrpE
MKETDETAPAPAAAEDTDARLAALETELEAALARAEQQRDAQLRLAAELDNLRRRTQREIENERRAALERCVLEFLPVKDGLDLGLAAASSAAGASADAAKLTDGMLATQRLFAAALERLGVEELDPTGQAFDPELHEAMMVQPSADHPDGTVLAVVQRGYRIAGRVMRPARVVVSSRPGPDHEPVEPPPQQGPLFN